MSKVVEMTLKEKYPNEGQLNQGGARQMNEDNYFKDHLHEQIARKYVQLNVHMECLNDVLELPPNTTIDTFAWRVRDLILASSTIYQEKKI